MKKRSVAAEEGLHLQQAVVSSAQHRLFAFLIASISPARASLRTSKFSNKKSHDPCRLATYSPRAIKSVAGNIAPAGDWDPANLLDGVDKGEVYRWREAELTHGRVGMLASLGFLVQEFWHPLFTADGGPAIEQIPKLPPALWVAMTID